MGKTGIGSHTKPNGGATVDWLTPPEIVQALGPFDLDPCCPERMPWETASVMWSNQIGDYQDEYVTLGIIDGLTEPWIGRVFLNPPYGRETFRWLEKLADHGNGIAVIFARTETRMFVSQVWHRANGILFLHGRPHFHTPDGQKAKGNSGGPVCLVAYGSGNVDALRRSKLPGTVMSAWYLDDQPTGKTKYPRNGDDERAMGWCE